MNLLWLGFIFGLVFSFVGLAIHRGYDFVQTVGFLFGNFGVIFGMAVVVGLALYGLSILLEGSEVHKSHDDDGHSGDMANLVL
jgi:vacuolar-type H+-ATPase subunit I/STV1